MVSSVGTDDEGKNQAKNEAPLEEIVEQKIHAISYASNVAAAQGVGVAVLSLAGVQIASRKEFPNFQKLPVSFKAILVACPAVFWYTYVSATSTAHTVDPNDFIIPPERSEVTTFSQIADLSRQKETLQLPFHQRLGMWFIDHPVKATLVGGTPLVAYTGWINYKLPDLTLTQRIARTSVAGQIALLGSMGGVLAFGSLYERKLPPKAKSMLRKHMTKKSMGEKFE